MFLRKSIKFPNGPKINKSQKIFYKNDSIRIEFFVLTLENILMLKLAKQPASAQYEETITDTKTS